jgi:hypothetical protein
MKLRVFMLTSAAVLMALVTSAHAERWCAAGPDQTLDHPCGWYIAIANRGLESVTPAWSKLEGVNGVTVKATRDYAEIDVQVSPEFFIESSNFLPEFVAGVPVRINPDLGGWVNDISPLPFAARSDFEAAEPIVDEHRDEWDRIPGVLDIAVFGCGTKSGCKIGVLVQAQLLQMARDQIPESIDGQQIVLVPYAGWSYWY